MLLQQTTKYVLKTASRIQRGKMFDDSILLFLKEVIFKLFRKLCCLIYSNQSILMIWRFFKILLSIELHQWSTKLWLSCWKWKDKIFKIWIFGTMLNHITAKNLLLFLVPYHTNLGDLYYFGIIKSKLG
jgi:hypothetical protein